MSPVLSLSTQVPDSISCGTAFLQTSQKPVLRSLINGSSYQPHNARKRHERFDLSSVYEQDHPSRTWWEATAPTLELMLLEAGYDKYCRKSGLKFLQDHVIPYLGPVPTSPLPMWKSFMTDDFSPIEYSWTWHDEPQVRYSVEMIGPEAGSHRDPFNRLQTLRAIESLKAGGSRSDWKLFELLYPVLEDRQASPSNQIAAVDKCDPSSLAMAFQSHGCEITTKAYMFLPESHSHDSFAILQDLLRALALAGLGSAAQQHFLRFVQPSTGPVHFTKPRLTFLCLAVDCVEPQVSRIKFYVRSTSTSFSTVRQVLQMGGIVRTAWTENELAELKFLWRSVLSLPQDFSEDQELPWVSHETSGILFYFDIHPKHSDPVPKVYIPVKHYGKNDQTVFAGLEHYLQGRSNIETTLAFKRVLDNMNKHRMLADDRGIQTYISCAPKNGNLELTSYLSPELYKRFKLSSVV